MFQCLRYQLHYEDISPEIYFRYQPEYRRVVSQTHCQRIYITKYTLPQLTYACVFVQLAKN